jgi:hypothetical protein
MKLFKEYGDTLFRADAKGLRESFAGLEPEPPYTDEWTQLNVKSREELIDAFVPHFYFGCEADDMSVAWAFNSKLNPGNSRIRAMFSSDAGHWDVQDMTHILGEAYELVEEGHINDEDFHDFTFGFPVSFYTSLNKDFFKGTRVESQVAKYLKK